jgi:thiol:disulfide interchange protein DsbD
MPVVQVVHQPRKRMQIRFILVSLLIGASLFLHPHLAAAAEHSSADVSAEINPLTVHAGDKATVAVIVDVHAGLHAQSHTPTDKEFGIVFTVTPDDQPGVAFGPVDYPAGRDGDYGVLGRLNVYVGKTVFKIPVQIHADAKPGPVTISGSVYFQACNDRACFNPETIPFSVKTTVVAADQPVAANAAFPTDTLPPVIEASSPAPTESTNDDDATFFGINLAKTTWPLAFAAAFLIGIIFNLMPCVLPVLPLKIMGFYEVSQHNRAKSIALGAVFSAGLIASFAVLAALVVGSHKLKWGELFEHTWFTVSIAGVLVVMAISTFGFFTVNVPNALYSFTPRHDTYVGNFLFGILTAALSTPCTFGMFVGLLAWALKQPQWVGGACIMMVGVGMASPYFILSALPELARKFPRTGPWAEVVKQMMGFLLLATAVYFARPLFQHVLSENVFWWSLFAVLAAGAVFLVIRAVQLSNNNLPRVIASVLALLIVVPAFGAAHLLTETPFQWTPYTDKALADATATGRPVVIDFTATWCGNCHYIEAFVLHNWRVVDAINSRKVVMLQADVTNNNVQARTLLDQLNPAGSIPVTAVYLPHQSKPKVLNGIYKPADLLNTLAGSK